MKIQRYILFTGIILIVGTVFSFPEVNAENLTIPFPQGNVYIINGYEESTTHQGKSQFSLDFRSYQNTDPCSSYGAPVLAAETGGIYEIRHAGKKDKTYGTAVKIKNNQGIKTIYAHLIENSLPVNVGSNVVQGQILGLLGDTGNTQGMICNAFDGTNFGAHLHFEMRNKDNATFKPEPMVGEMSYTDISKAGNPYISTTVMLDPEGFWEIWKGKVPYKFSDTPEKEWIWERFWKSILRFVSRNKTWTNDLALEYVKAANGEYGDEFLRWVGWEGLGKVSDVRGEYPLYEISYKRFDMRKMQDFMTVHDPSYEPLEGQSPQVLIGNILFRKDAQKEVGLYLTPYHIDLDKKKMQFFSLFPERGEINFYKQLPDNALIKAAQNLGLRFEDNSFDLYAAGNAPLVLLEPFPCPFSTEDQGTLLRKSNRESYYETMEKVWKSSLPLAMKFYVQNEIDLSVMNAIFLEKIFLKNHFSCMSFLYAFGEIKMEYYKKIPFDKLQWVYDEFFIKD